MGSLFYVYFQNRIQIEKILKITFQRLIHLFIQFIGN